MSRCSLLPTGPIGSAHTDDDQNLPMLIGVFQSTHPPRPAAGGSELGPHRQIPREQVVDAVDRVPGDEGEDTGKPSLGIDIVELGGDDRGVSRCLVPFATAVDDLAY